MIFTICNLPYTINGMIGFLRGTIIDKYKDEIILDVNGVGYRVRVGEKRISNYEARTTNYELYIHTAVREDAITLYGFKSRGELQVYEMLLDVSGIGPKTAMGIISNCSAEEIENAIRQADVNFFTCVPGIGKKGAQRIIIDLKSKIGSLKDIDLHSANEDDNVVLALQQFGFKPVEIQSALKHINRTLSEQQQIKEGLKLLGKTRI